MSMEQNLSSLEIKNFRGLSDIKFEDVGSFNILLGGNGVGKTSILEAIFLLTGVGNASLQIMIQNLRGYVVRGFDGLSYLFHGIDVGEDMKIAAQINRNIEKISLFISAQESETSEGYQQIIQGGEGNMKNEINKAVLEGMASTAPQTPRSLEFCWIIQNPEQKDRRLSRRLEILPDGSMHTPSPAHESKLQMEESQTPAEFFSLFPLNYSEATGQVIVNKKKDMLLKAMRSIDDSVVDISVQGDTVYVDIGLKEMVPLNMFGSGLMRAVQFVSRSIVSNTAILLIDEIENGLHYKAISGVINALLAFSTERGMQIFATTHSISVLESLREVLSDGKWEEYRNNVTCYSLARDKNNLVRSYRFGYPELDHCIKSGIEIR